MSTNFKKENDYTLQATSSTPTGATLTRYFNFAAQQVTTLYERKEQLTDNRSSTWGTSGSVAAAVSIALAADLKVQNFSDIDSLAEIRLMHAELVKLGGTPPEVADVQDKKAIAAPKLTSTP